MKTHIIRHYYFILIQRKYVSWKAKKNQNRTFAKAFDRIDHGILIKKLSTFPINACLIKLLKSYLENRKQYVCLYGEISECITPLSSVPQGSILSPLLFSLFINDLPPLIKSNILLFADDVKIFLKIKSLSDARQLQSDIDTIIDWCNRNNLQINANKCYTMSFTRRRENNFQYFNYNVNGLILNKLTSIKDLGVLFDSKLSSTIIVNIPQKELTRCWDLSRDHWINSKKWELISHFTICT